jgi:hypothetical protein
MNIASGDHTRAKIQGPNGVSLSAKTCFMIPIILICVLVQVVLHSNNSNNKDLSAVSKVTGAVGLWSSVADVVIDQVKVTSNSLKFVPMVKGCTVLHYHVQMLHC